MALGEGAARFRAPVDSLAPAPTPGAGERPRRGGGEKPPATLDAVSAELLSAAMAMQDADVAPTTEQVAACARARADAAVVLARWKGLAGEGLRRLNARRSAAGLEEISVSP
jgi:hypothetical protein